MNVPILGRGPNERAIQIVEDVLKKLRTGELINVAVVCEQRDDGQLLGSYDVAPANGEAMKMCGGLGLVAAAIHKKLLGG